MSFSSEVKKEIILYTDSRRHCRIAELASIICFCGSYDGNLKILTVQNDNKELLEKYVYLLDMLFEIKTEISKNEVCISGKNAYDVLNVSGFMENGGYSGHMNSMIINSLCCRRAFIRGAFICCGSLCDPKKNYHLEFLCHYEDTAKELMKTINSFEMDSKTIKRKNYYIVYLKEADQIVQLLNIMAANKAYLELESMRVVKDVRNSVNRIVNCETANLNKIVSAAVIQRESIEYIRDTIGLDSLPEQLREIAEARLECPDMSLKEIGEILTPPVGKSGVNHRFKKIIAMADNLREEYKNVRTEN